MNTHLKRSFNKRIGSNYQKYYSQLKFRIGKIVGKKTESTKRNALIYNGFFVSFRTDLEKKMISGGIFLTYFHSHKIS